MKNYPCDPDGGTDYVFVHDFRDDANPYREAECHRSGDPSPECNSAPQRAPGEKVPSLPSDWQVRDEPYRGPGVREWLATPPDKGDFVLIILFCCGAALWAIGVILPHLHLD